MDPIFRTRPIRVPICWWPIIAPTKGHLSGDGIRSDNGPEFIAEAVRDWIKAVGAKTAYIEPGSPWESFNRRMRDELPNGEIFYSLREAQIIIERWRNTTTPSDHTVHWAMFNGSEQVPMTDAQALSEIEEAKRILDKHHASGFLIGVWHERDDGICYRYADCRYDELAEHDSEGKAA